MRTIKRHTRPQKSVFCLLLVTVLLCLTVFAAVPENGVNTPMFGAGETHSHDSARNRSGDNGAANAAEDVVTDAADAIGGAVSDAGNAVGEVIGDIGEAAGEVVSDAGNAIGDAADAIGGAVTDKSNSGNQSNADENKADAAMPFDTHAVDVPGNATTSGTVTNEDAPAGAGWIWILILIAAAAAVFFLILMPKRSREM